MNRHNAPHMTQWAKAIVGAAVALLLLAATSAASPHARQFIAGLEAYQAARYGEAIAHWETIAESGVANGQLFYNLGNAHLKADHLGPAILWYERAHRLIPNDPDLRFNLAYARSLTKDTPEETAAPIVHILFFWKYQLSHRTIVVAAIAGNVLFWFLFAGWRLIRRRGLLRAAITVSVPVFILMATAAFNYYERAHLKEAVILPDRVSVRSGFQETDTELFVLHAGAKVQVVRDAKAHHQIRYSPEKTGWVARETVGLIDDRRSLPDK